MNAITELKTPPNSIEAEQAVIGAVLAYREALNDLDITPEDFYRREHKTIWQALRDMAMAGKAADWVTLQDYLIQSGKLKEAGGTGYLVELAGQSSGVVNLSHYAAIVMDRAVERRLISIGHQISDMGYNPDGRSAAERVSLATGLLTDMDSREDDEPVSVGTCLREAVLELERRFDRKGEMLGIPTGFANIDNRTQGLMPGNLVIVAGRPSMGKSTLALNIAEHNANQGKLVIFFSLEMSRQELTFKLISSMERIPMKTVHTAGMDNNQWEKVVSANARAKSWPLYLADHSVLTSAQVLSRSRRIARKMGMAPSLVIVDYLQLLADKGDNLNERTAKISRNLKLAAKELNCPVIALSQLSRKLEERGDKRPIMSDLRDSGAVEQDADLIFMVYREEVYKPETNRKGVAEILCRKFRNGQTGDDFLAANLHLSRFDNLQPGHVLPADPPKRKGGFQYAD